MKIPLHARYDYCAKKACEFLEEYHISSYPIDVEKIIIDSHWGLTPYSLLMKQFNCDRNTVIRCLRSKDGYTQLDKDNYSIAYNDDPALGNRKRFTLMHEIGHIYLNHLVDFDVTLLYRGSLTQDENKVLENEANAFARNISTKFGITYRAANARQDLFKIDYDVIDKIGLLQRMSNIFRNFYNKTTCSKCNAYFSFHYRNFCPICGSKKTLKWGDGDIMKYPLLETYENGKLKECPNCHNEETSIDGEFCQICGKSLINTCTNSDCGFSHLPSNARYCPLCGYHSSFYKSKLLKDWNYKEPPSLNFEDMFKTIPDATEDEIDEELPFN